MKAHFLEGKFSEGLVLIPKILKGIKRYKNKIDSHHVMMFYYKISCVYLGEGGDYESCILYLEKIIENKDLKMREDLLCFSRILSIFALYKARFNYHLETHLRNTYKF